MMMTRKSTDGTATLAREDHRSEAERLAAIGEMVTGLVHESRNTLQRSQACLEMLALEVGDRPAALDLIARLQAAQDHLRDLHQEGMAIARRIVEAHGGRIAVGPDAGPGAEIRVTLPKE
jgi:hypothetical protein